MDEERRAAPGCRGRVWRPAHEQLVLTAAGAARRGHPSRARLRAPGEAYRPSSVATPPPTAWSAMSAKVRIAAPFVDVDDLAELYLLALAAPAGSLYYATVGASVKVKDLARAAARGRARRSNRFPSMRPGGKSAEWPTPPPLHQVISSEKAPTRVGLEARPQVCPGNPGGSNEREPAGGTSAGRVEIGQCPAPGLGLLHRTSRRGDGPAEGQLRHPRDIVDRR